MIWTNSYTWIILFLIQVSPFIMLCSVSIEKHSVIWRERSRKMTVLIIWDNKGTALYCRYSSSSEMFLIAVILYMHAKWEKKKTQKTWLSWYIWIGNISYLKICYHSVELWHVKSGLNISEKSGLSLLGKPLLVDALQFTSRYELPGPSCSKHC